MSPRLKTWLGNLGVAGLSVFLTLAVLEHVVFRFILPPDDLLENVTINGVVRYMPNTQATFRHPDGRTSRVTINADGWNSTRPEYKTARTPGTRRIAVIGDSYVHGAFVNVDEAFPEIMERDLKARGAQVEVLRFGMDGAPLSQYLHVLRREVLAYKPDIVLVPLIHNDFDESYRFLRTRYASSFMKLARDESGTVTEVPPGEFRYGLADSLRGYRTFRYLYYETNLYLHAKGFISRWFWGGDEQWSPEHISSAVDIRKIADHQANRFFTRYVMAQMRKLAIEHGFRLAFVMDGVREAVYAGKPASEYEVGMLNRIAADVARELGLPFLDLQETFERDWKARGQRFEYTYDWHWNAHANRLVAEAANGLLTGDSRIGLAVPRRAAGLDRHTP
jgi:hypothetical protein